MRNLGNGAIPFSGGLYPWSWEQSEQKNFNSLQGGLLVPPILQKLILNREPTVVLEWVDKICKWPFERIITSHIGNDIKANNKDFNQAFSFLRLDKKGDIYDKNIPKPQDADLFLLNTLSDIFTKYGIVSPPARS